MRYVTTRGDTWPLLTLLLLPFAAVASDNIAAASPPDADQTPAALASSLLVEAEEFKPATGEWRVIGFGENYYAATLANTFISRQKLLSAPEQCQRSEAAWSGEIPAAGRYRAWTRYECPSNFAVEHTLRIEQGGRVVLERKFGALANPKLWPFAKGITPMVNWDWGSGDNVVWEPADQPVELARGPVKFTLIADNQPTDLPRGGPAKRNIDCVYLTTDLEEGIRDASKAFYHLMDRVLAQTGECFIRISNPAGAATPISAKLRIAEHNPYWQHRGPLPAEISMAGGSPAKADADWIAPGQSSPWVAIGQALDTTNMQELYVTAQPQPAAGQTPPDGAKFVIEFAGDAAGSRPIRRFEFQHPETATAIFEVPHDLRGDATIRTLEEHHEELLAYLQSLPKHGRVPTQVPVFGIMGGEWHGHKTKTPDQFYRLRTETGLVLGRNTWKRGSIPADLEAKHQPQYLKNLEIDVRGTPTPKLAEQLDGMKAKGELEQVLVVSMGDEIGVGGFKPGDAKEHEAFRAYLAAAKAPIDAASAQLTNDPAGDPKLYYWSQMFSIDRGIDQLRERTEIVERIVPKPVYTGANYSPHPQYWPHAGQWVRLFRRRGMTMPWSEDWTHQIPDYSSFVSGYLCDVFRCAGRPENMPIQYYTMPHWPGQTARDFTLSAYSSIAHGNKVLNFFAAVPIYDYTENYVAWEARDNWKAIYDVVHDVGLADDLIATGHVRPAQVAMLISHTTDIWEQARGSSIYNFERKNLYFALRHAQIPVDFVTEEDVADGVLKDYRVLYLCGDHLLRRAAKPLREWVRGGGDIVSVAGGGFLDEYNQPLDTLREVYGVAEQQLMLSEKNTFLKEGLAWLPALDEVRLASASDDKKRATFPAIIARQEVKPIAPETDSNVTVVAQFRDGAPAVVTRQFGRGTARLIATFPGSAYMQTSIPRRPMDRSAGDEGFNHFLPTKFNWQTLSSCVDTAIAKTEWPVFAGLLDQNAGDPIDRERVVSSGPLDITVIDAPSGIVVPIANYTRREIAQLTVTITAKGPFREAFAVRAGPLKNRRNSGDTWQVTIPLGWADMIVLRR